MAGRVRELGKPSEYGVGSPGTGIRRMSGSYEIVAREERSDISRGSDDAEPRGRAAPAAEGIAGVGAWPNVAPAGSLSAS